MKIKLLFLSLIGVAAVANAQYTVTDEAGNKINDGDIIEFGTTAYPEASFDFYVTNDNPSEEIYSRIESLSSQNATSPIFEQLCYGTLCYYGIAIGDFVPPMNTSPVVIPVGQTTGMGNHLYNDDAGNGSDNVDFVFAFRQYSDAAGTVETGTPLTFTYRFNPTLGIEASNKIGLSVLSTVVSDHIDLVVSEPIEMSMYNVQGKIVRTAKFEEGNHSIDVSSLNSQMYVLKFRNGHGATKTTKILIK